MNKILKYSLIGLGVVAAGTTLYFVFRKPKGESDENKSTDEKEPEKKDESKGADESAKDTSSSMPETASIKTVQPSTTKPVATADVKKPVVNTDKLKGYNVQTILSKTRTEKILVGKDVIAEKNGTRLLDKNGKLMFTLKKDDVVGNLKGAKLTAKGDYLAYVKMRDGKVTQTLAGNLKFA